MPRSLHGGDVRDGSLLSAHTAKPTAVTATALTAASLALTAATRLHQPRQKPRPDRRGEPHTVRGRRPARRLHKPGADARPHVQQRQLRGLV